MRKKQKNIQKEQKTEKELEILNTVQCKGVEFLSFGERDLFNGIQDRKRAREQGFKDGVELGYNKANEWHYVSKEGHPTKDDIYLIIRKDGLHLGDYCCGGNGDIDCQSWCDYPSEEEIQDDSVIAWKEIILPEE